AVSFNGAEVSWAPALGTAAPAGCVTLMRTGGVIEINAGALRGVTIIRNRQSQSIGVQAFTLSDGDELHLMTTRFRYREAELPAAATRYRARRYSFEGDATQLIGFGALSGGIEGALEQDDRQRLERGRSSLERELRLSIDGDLQRLLSRTLATGVKDGVRQAIRRNPQGAVTRGPDFEARVNRTFDALRAAALLMDAEDGRILAVASLPRFDPWRSARDGSTLTRMKLGSSQSKEEQLYLENYAFRRAKEIGSTQKIATSIALARAGLLTSAATQGTSCANKMEIVSGAARIAQTSIKCDQHSTHNALSDGAPVWSAWREAFSGSCNIYFGLAAASLVPGIDIGATTTTRHSQPLFTIPANLDPGVALRPANLATPGTGNGFFETAMLLGYRFEFRGADINLTHSYNGLPYPTVQHRWLEGLEERAFTYPTMPAAETFSNTFHGDAHWPDEDNTVLTEDGDERAIIGRENLRNYLLLGFGQNLTGSPLSIATMTTPIFNSTGVVATPAILANASTTPRPPATGLVSGDRQMVLRDGLALVVRYGTGKKYFDDVTFPAGVTVGGKTGTITIEDMEPSADPNDLHERAYEYGCGTIGASVSAMEWQTLAAQAGVASSTTLPAWGFAAGMGVCARLNPGLPRVGGTMDANNSVVWEHMKSRVEGRRSNRKVASSAFLAAMWPESWPSSLRAGDGTQVPLRNALTVTLPHPLVLAVVADHHESAAKDAAADIASEVLRLLATRR
ncbi:MAG TPA: penicillin-binding transpeptidase domain-containing protein, partial [Thermoanaerobaculia bacterium]